MPGSAACRARGFASGAGDQIGPKTPPANYAAMLRALAEVRAEEGGGRPS